MGVVDYAFYTNVYKGNDATETSFPALCARAEDIVGAATHWVDFAEIKPPMIQLLYKKAICAQIDFLAVNGIDSINETADAGFTGLAKGNLCHGRSLLNFLNNLRG